MTVDVKRICHPMDGRIVLYRTEQRRIIVLNQLPTVRRILLAAGTAANPQAEATRAAVHRSVAAGGTILGDPQSPLATPPTREKHEPPKNRSPRTAQDARSASHATPNTP